MESEWFPFEATVRKQLFPNETIVKATEDLWHVILYGDKINTREMLKTAYRRSLFRIPILTDQRLLFIKDGEINREVSLDNIAEASSHRQHKIGPPYFTLRLKDGNIMNIMFECITERILFGGTEMEIAWTKTQQWVKEITRQLEKKATQIRTYPDSTSYPAPRNTGNAKFCGECGINLPLDAKYCSDCGARQTSDLD